ncbi:hypothetical protein CURTO8I2_180158 [Curtobacterium sp. 8I-2]|nr:hypothetical protein CURTO8I2_180158 [Curtobacterium sp. 8I-2]
MHGTTLTPTDNDCQNRYEGSQRDRETDGRPGASWHRASRFRDARVYGLVAASIVFSAIVSSSRPGVRRFHFLITKLNRK